MKKPIVEAEILSKTIVGLPMNMRPTNHPRYELNYRLCTSSRVLKIHDNGDIETQNTVYRPIKNAQEEHARS